MNLIELTPRRHDLAESTLAEIPGFIIRFAKTITPIISKNEASAITFGKLFELEWIEAKL
jgi:hypothetical protein